VKDFGVKEEGGLGGSGWVGIRCLRSVGGAGPRCVKGRGTYGCGWATGGRIVRLKHKG